MGRDLTLEDIQSAYNSGVRKIVVSVAQPDIAKKQIETIVEFNKQAAQKIVVETYRYISLAYVDYDLQQAKDFITICRSTLYDVQFHWHDWEDIWNPATQAEKEAACQKAIDDYVGFCNTGFYSAYWYWTQYMENTDKFKDVPWWFALYDNNPNLDLGKYAFGGITEPQMKQYAGNVTIGGIYCDADYYEDAQSGDTETPVVIAQGVFTNVEHDTEGKARKITLDIVG